MSVWFWEDMTDDLVCQANKHCDDYPISPNCVLRVLKAQSKNSQHSLAKTVQC